ncbi:hypothetical protein BDY19DRAFT_908126 [Irpex rosettiformis]|uniref:Uncharacterized protein n=1 Tax=Irpex rosettiformis TaxID=378272 RepID=A0ACB8TXK7_9APHY|nr:hypothetical protein BDY19DRAFT_908126 [Irpex rosettiformis]
MVETRSHSSSDEDATSGTFATPRKRVERREYVSSSRPGMLRLRSMVKTSIELDLSGLTLADSVNAPQTPQVARVKTVVSSSTTLYSSRPRRIVSEIPVEVSDSSPEQYSRSKRDESLSPTRRSGSIRSSQSLSYADARSHGSNVAESMSDQHEDQQCVEEEMTYPVKLSPPSMTTNGGSYSNERMSRRSHSTPRAPLRNNIRKTDQHHKAAPNAPPTKGTQSTNRPQDSAHSPPPLDNEGVSMSYTYSPPSDDPDEEMRFGLRRADLVRLVGYESEPDDSRYAKKAWYTVIRGQGHTGIYKSWERVFQLTNGVSGAHLKGYQCKKDALAAYRNALRNGAVRKLPKGKEPRS